MFTMTYYMTVQIFNPTYFVLRPTQKRQIWENLNCALFTPQIQKFVIFTQDRIQNISG